MSRFVRKQAVAEMFGVHGATIMRWVRDGRFPKPFSLTPRGRVFFDSQSIEAYLETRGCCPSGDRLPVGSHANKHSI